MDLLITLTEDVHKNKTGREKVLTLQKPFRILKKNIAEY